MSTDPQAAPRRLPDRPNLRHLKDQAKDLLKTGAAKSVTDAQFKIACLYGFASWPKLKAHVESFEEIGQLKQAVDANDIVRVKTLMMRNPALHSAPLGYGKDGPLTWVAECRVPRESPSPARLAMAEWMIEPAAEQSQNSRRVVPCLATGLEEDFDAGAQPFQGTCVTGNEVVEGGARIWMAAHLVLMVATVRICAVIEKPFESSWIHRLA